MIFIRRYSSCIFVLVGPLLVHLGGFHPLGTVALADLVPFTRHVSRHHLAALFVMHLEVSCLGVDNLKQKRRVLIVLHHVILYGC